MGRGQSYQSAHSQVLLDNDVVDGSHDESYLHGVRRAGEVRVDLLCGVLVESTGKLSVSESHTCACICRLYSRYESVEDVIACCTVILATFIVREVVLHWRHG